MLIMVPNPHFFFPSFLPLSKLSGPRCGVQVRIFDFSFNKGEILGQD